LRYPRHPGAVSSVGRAPARQAGGHWFEPSTAHHRKAPLRRGFSWLAIGSRSAYWLQNGRCWPPGPPEPARPAVPPFEIPPWPEEEREPAADLRVAPEPLMLARLALGSGDPGVAVEVKRPSAPLRIDPARIARRITPRRVAGDVEAPLSPLDVEDAPAPDRGRDSWRGSAVRRQLDKACVWCGVCGADCCPGGNPERGNADGCDNQQFRQGLHFARSVAPEALILQPSDAAFSYALREATRPF
jgi:hypothetical protein